MGAKKKGGGKKGKGKKGKKEEEKQEETGRHQAPGVVGTLTTSTNPFY